MRSSSHAAIVNLEVVLQAALVIVIVAACVWGNCFLFSYVGCAISLGKVTRF